MGILEGMRTRTMQNPDLNPMDVIFNGNPSEGYESLVGAMKALIDMSPLRQYVTNAQRYSGEKEEIACGVTAQVLTTIPYERLFAMEDWGGVLRRLLEYKLSGVVNGFIRREHVSGDEFGNPPSEYSPHKVFVEFGGGLDSRTASVFSLSEPEDDLFEVIEEGGDGKSGLSSLATLPSEESRVGKPQDTDWSVGDGNISKEWAAYWARFENSSQGGGRTSGKRKKRTTH